MAITAVVVCIGLLFGWLLKGWRDAQDLSWVRCQVVDAKAHQPGPYEFKFGSVSQRRAQGESWWNQSAQVKDVRRLPIDESSRT